MTPSRRLRRLTGAVAGAAALGWSIPSVMAPAVAGDVRVTPSDESWYRAVSGPDTCDLQAGCAPTVPALPVGASPYAPGTLHVGVTGGIEDSRTYLRLDLSALPEDMVLTGGSLLLPVATDPGSGTAVPERARLRACGVVGTVNDRVEGATAGAPVTDCSVSSPAVFGPGSAGSGPAFRVDLGPFADASFRTSRSIALVPVPGQAPSDSWHVAFSRRDRAVPSDQRISAQVALAPLMSEPEPSADAAAEPAPFVEAGPGLLAEPAPVPFDAVESSLAPPLAAAPPDATASAPAPIGGPQRTVPIASVGGRGFVYPGVFLLPLLMAVAVAWTGRAFTRDLARADD